MTNKEIIFFRFTSHIDLPLPVARAFSRPFLKIFFNFPHLFGVWVGEILFYFCYTFSA